MTRDLKLDSTGDLAIENGSLVLLDAGEEAIAQDATCRLRFIRGEWFLARGVGVEYFEEILVKNPSLPAVRAIFERELLATPGVVEVLEIQTRLDSAQRLLDVSFRARIDTGAIIAGTIGSPT